MHEYNYVHAEVKNLTLSAIHARLAITGIFEQFDLTRDAAKSVRTVTLEAPRLVEADAAVFTGLTATVISRVMFTESTFHSRWTDADKVAADTAWWTAP